MNILQYILLLLVRLLKQCLYKISNLIRSIFGGGFNNGSEMEMSNRTLTFESDGLRRFRQPRRVRIGRQIAEGGFSYVYEAFDETTDKKYALKRLNCGTDKDLARKCREEAGVHRTFSHKSILKLLGYKMEKSDAPSTSMDDGTKQHVCYMLFPYLEGGSLRDEITRRNLLPSCNGGDTRSMSVSLMQPRPFTQKQVLQLFYEIVFAVSVFHDAGLSHRDLKLENIMVDVQRANYSEDGRKDDDDDDEEYKVNKREKYGVNGIPVLMDFGSAGPLSVPLQTRSDVLTLTEEASSHTTVSYRPPELFEGGCRHGSGSTLDYGRVDVWSLGCILFGLMYGSSPFEIEFVRSATNESSQDDVKIVECTHLRVLGSIPRPREHTDIGTRYGKEIMDLVQWILVQDRLVRPDVKAVLEKVESLLVKSGGTAKKKNVSGGGRNRTGMISGFGNGDNGDDDDDEENLFDSLLR